MRINFLTISAGIVCSACLINPALADFGSSSAPPPSTVPAYNSSTTPPASGFGSSVAPAGGQYNSSANNPAPQQQVTHAVETRHKKHNRFSIDVNIPGSDTVLSYREGKHFKTHQKHGQPFWIPMHVGEELPANAVISGNQYNPNVMFYVCRANFRGGVHPGKYLSGSCNFSWGGREIVAQNYEVLVSQIPLAWAASSNGAIPHHAIPGGEERHRTLYICQAEYQNGTHSGKLVGNTCNFGWGGREIVTPYYNVLVR